MSLVQAISGHFIDKAVWFRIILHHQGIQRANDVYASGLGYHTLPEGFHSAVVETIREFESFNPILVTCSYL